MIDSYGVNGKCNAFKKAERVRISLCKSESCTDWQGVSAGWSQLLVLHNDVWQGSFIFRRPMNSFGSTFDMSLVVSKSLRRCANNRVVLLSPILQRRLGNNGFHTSSTLENEISYRWQIIPPHLKAGEFEDKTYFEIVRRIEGLWASQRWKGIKRPYTAEDVASKRGGHGLGPQAPTTPGLKLFELLSRRFEAKEPVYTCETGIQVP